VRARKRVPLRLSAPWIGRERWMRVSSVMLQQECGCCLWLLPLPGFRKGARAQGKRIGAGSGCGGAEGVSGAVQIKRV
jgi:hypothetical protein